MSCSATILRGLPGLLVALLMAFVGSRGDVWLGAACVAVTTSPIALAQTASFSVPSTERPARAERVSRPARNELLAASELGDDAELDEIDELDERRDGSSACVLPSVRADFEARSRSGAGSDWDDRGSKLLSHRISKGHPRGPPAARLG